MHKPHRPDLAALPELRYVRPGFLLTFSLAGLLAVALVAFAVSRIVGAELRSAQLAGVTRSAELLVVSTLAPQLPAGAGQLDPRQLETLDRAMLSARRTVGIDGGTIWNSHARVLYSTDHRLIGTTVSRPQDVLAAFSGKTSTAARSRVPWSTEAFVGKQMDVAVPLYGHNATKPSAVAELIVPEEPVAQQVSDQTQHIDFILFGAALLFYAALWPILLRASKAARGQSDPHKKALLRELGNAIEQDELLLLYQPTVNLAQGRVTGVEALLRWRHPKHGLLAPSEFLPSVLDGALNSKLALHVIALALRDCGAWRERGIDAGVNVNLSIPNVLDDALCEQIGTMLASTGIPPGALGLEVTEAALIANPEKAAGMLRSLDSMGVRICIDDFGTGYSSLACLRDLPVAELKVDHKFIGGLHLQPRDKMIVRLIVRLAHELDVRVIAEGVEDLDTLKDLAEIDCDEAQGYYFSAPLPLVELVAWFEAPAVAGHAQLAESAAS